MLADQLEDLVFILVDAGLLQDKIVHLDEDTDKLLGGSLLAGRDNHNLEDDGLKALDHLRPLILVELVNIARVGFPVTANDDLLEDLVELRSSLGRLRLVDILFCHADIFQFRVYTLFLLCLDL